MINYKIKKLPNGICLVTAPLPASEAVTILILVGVGGRYEKAQQNGISHFLEHLFFKGSKQNPSPYELSKKIDGLGASANAFTGEEYTGFYIQSDANDFEKSLGIISDLFLNPIFAAKEIEREKGVILEEANMRHDVPQYFVQVLAQKQMFGNSSLGQDLVGKPETIKSISRNDILDYFGNYSPKSTVIIITGNPKKFNWTGLAAKIFSQKSPSVKPKFAKIEKIKIATPISSETRKVDQAHFVLSTITYPKSHPNRYIVSLIATILAGGMSSRLFREIREKRGWAYYIKSDLSAYWDTGMIQFSAGVKQDKLTDSLKIITREIEKLKTKGPDSDELQRAKRNLRGHLALGLEDSFEIASFLAEELLYSDKVRQPEEIINGWQKVSKQDIQKVCQEVFQSDRMGLSVISSKVATELKKTIDLSK
ncbi:hypothetical protein COT77_03490 [Candidatus Berkelbacteria bacterium CG10_big_fil_rev_8_21_14_0_10_41_12]|uniref:Peptidase M16 n=1 Tax=Candidatus Berkelbacteria bacterium CG10_big_fil_rev_8_21_14_0_10_41_12 TaxID=1974513 RepID=A0A2M6WW82_9BACT|nr:MAG: hypothetical protein COT77_03490 [Candidatus Berkelbacteria bacterium CG10_big_fil_rev_8_21_14_0_10_41_12]